MPYHLAFSQAYRKAAFQLVYQSYLESGLGTDNPYGMRVMPYQLCPTSQILIGVVRSEVASTVTLVGNGELGLPMQSMFSDEIDLLQAAGNRVAEVSCLAYARTSSSEFIDTFRELTWLVIQFARFHGLDCLLIAVHPRHAKFYQRHLGFQRIGDRVVSCPHVQDQPAMALCLELKRFDVKCPAFWHGCTEYCLTTDMLSPYEIPNGERLLLEQIARWCGKDARAA